ncbi:TPA: PTS transporter subunit EIIC [Klebsiella variicola]
MNNKEIATKILSRIGGEGNISHFTHCVTRLRITLLKNDLADKNGLKGINGVLGVAESNGQLQVVLGNRVGDVYNEIQNIMQEQHETVKPEPHHKGKRKNIISVLLEAISGIFSPIIPAIIGAGLLKGVIVLLTTYHVVEKDSQGLIILNSISDAAFYFLPVLLGFSSAKKFSCNPYLGAVMGAILLHPSLTSLMNSHSGFLSFFGIPLKSTIYISSVLPVILSVWFMSYVEKLLSKILNASLRTVFQPLLTLVISAPVMLIVIAPIGAVLGQSVAAGFMFLYFKTGLLAGAILGGFYPFIIMTGMHYGFLPIMFESISHTGFDYIMAIGTASNAAQSGAALAVFIQARNVQLKGTSGAAAINAMIGISEPALFGVTAPLKTPLIAVALAGAMGGAFMSYFQIGASGIGTGPLAGLPFFFGPNFTKFIIGCLISFSVSFVATWMLKFNENLIVKAD